MIKISLAFLLLVCSNAVFADVFKKFEINENGKQLKIILDNGKEISPPLIPNQIGFSNVLIARKKTTLGWLEMYPDCCSSNPIALSLAVLQSDKPVKRFKGDGRAIFGWCFLAGGSEVAFYQSDLNGNSLRHFEHHSLADGKLLEVFDEQESNLEKPLPTWTSCLL